jgi:hypothetical protein
MGISWLAHYSRVATAATEEDIDDAGASAPDGQDDHESLIHARGKPLDLRAQPLLIVCMDVINTARAWVSV